MKVCEKCKIISLNTHAHAKSCEEKILPQSAEEENETYCNREIIVHQIIIHFDLFCYPLYEV